MKRIALLYTTAKLTVLTYDALAVNQTTFETIKKTEPIVNSVVDSGVLLNGRKFSSTLYAHREFQIIISADEVDDTVLTFLQNFWLGRFKYISHYNETTEAWGDYIQVQTGGGVFPVEYIDEIYHLPEVSFDLSYVVKI